MRQSTRYNVNKIDDLVCLFKEKKVVTRGEIEDILEVRNKNIPESIFCRILDNVCKFLPVYRKTEYHVGKNQQREIEYSYICAETAEQWEKEHESQEIKILRAIGRGEIW